MVNISVHKSNSGRYIEVYDNVNSFDLTFQKYDLGKMIKIFKKLMSGDVELPYQPTGHYTAYNLGKSALLSMDSTLRTGRLDGNWVEKGRLKVIHDKLVELYNNERLSDLRSLKALYRKDKKDLKEKLSVVSITTLNNIADKLKKRRENAQSSY